MIRFRVAALLSSLLAFSALGYEILWARFYSFATGSLAEAFGAMLGSYLLGVAIGALLSRQIQIKTEMAKASVIISRAVLASAALSVIAAPVALWFCENTVSAASHPLKTLPVVVSAAAASDWGLCFSDP